MTDDQQLMWDTLSCNYAKISHAWAQELTQLNKPRSQRLFHAHVDKCLNTTLSWPVEQRARAIKTWLSTYRLPLDLKKLKCSEQFRQSTGDYIVDNSRYITAYERQDGI